MGGWLNNREGLYNLDESAFSVAEKVDFVYARRGTKNVLSCFDGNEKEMVTVLACGNAAGNILRPLILFDGKVHLASRFRGTENRCWLGVNRSGFMDCQIFADYIKNEVIPSMTAEKNIIFVDGHSSHIYNEEFLITCAESEKYIKVVVFPAGQTSRTQPFDFKVFGPVKKIWKDYLRTLNLTITTGVTKQTFAAHLIAMWDSFNMPDNLISGFLTAGISPFDPCAVCRDFPGFAPAILPVQKTCPYELYASDFAAAIAAFRRIPAYSEDDIAKIMKVARHLMEGSKPSVFAEDQTVVYKKTLFEKRSPKRLYEKDTRMGTEMGAIATDQSFLTPSEINK